MKLTKSADYALRILIYLAGKEQQITNTALSKALEVPYHNLTKIIQHLARSEVIRSKKGKNGGITLNKRPEDISVRQVISIIDGPLNLSDCNRNAAACSFTQTCKLKPRFKEMEQRINKILDEVVLSELV